MCVRILSARYRAFSWAGRNSIVINIEHGAKIIDSDTYRRVQAGET